MQWIRIAVASLACVFGVVAHSADVAGLYETIVSPSADKNRDSAFVEALRMVAVKATGQRDAGTKISSNVPNLRTYVQRFEPVRGDGSVLIQFDSAAVDRLLTTLGLPLWGRERPSILVWLAIPDATGKPVWVGADQISPERDIVEHSAQSRGLPIVWPTMDAADQDTAASLMTAHSSSQALLASADRYRADAVLFGIANRDATGAFTVQWSFAIGNSGATDAPVAQSQASLDEGIQIAADRCAQLFAVSSAARSDVRVQIAGVRDLDAYASAMNYLQALTVVLGISVDQVSGDTLRLRVAVRGDASTLRHAVELKRRAAAIGVDSAAASTPNDDSLKLRYVQ